MRERKEGIKVETVEKNTQHMHSWRGAGDHGCHGFSPAKSKRRRLFVRFSTHTHTHTLMQCTHTYIISNDCVPRSIITCSFAINLLASLLSPTSTLVSVMVLANSSVLVFWACESTATRLSTSANSTSLFWSFEFAVPRPVTCGGRNGRGRDGFKMERRRKGIRLKQN